MPDDLGRDRNPNGTGMIRELVDIAWLEDFLNGLGRGSGLRHAAYDRSGLLVSAADATLGLSKATGSVLQTVPTATRFVRLLPADEPPAEVAFVAGSGLHYVVAPVHLDERLAGFAAVGEFRDGELSAADKMKLLESMHSTPAELDRLWANVPELQRRGDAAAVQATRWLARMLADTCRRESQIISTSEELSLVGDMAELLHGDQELQTVLNRIVAETARVMQCKFCSLRLLDPHSGELRLAAVHNLSEAYLNKGVVFHGENPIDQEAMAGKLVYIEDAGSDPRVRFPEDARREGIVSGLTAGLIYRGQPVGVIRVYTDRRLRFRAAQRKLLRAVAFQAATAIVHARLLEERLAAARTQRQLELAGDLQARLMRSVPPPKPRIRIASIFQPSAEVGGDYCDFLLLADGRLACVVADVVGKGVKASLLSTYLRGALHAIAGVLSDPAALVTRLNRQLCDETVSGEFITLLLVAVSEDGRSLEYCNAGHEPLLRLRGRQTLVTQEGGLVLGVREDEAYSTARLDLQADDLCLMYTDGAIEALNFAGEAFGRARLAKSVQQNGRLELSTALRAMQWDIRRFAGLAEQMDDLTLVGLRVVE